VREDSYFEIAETRGRADPEMRTNLSVGEPALLSALLLVVLGVFTIWAPYMLCPTVAMAQDVTSAGGLGEVERDTLREDSRVEGRESQIVDSRISDQKIGYEERKIRLERRAEELLRAEEASRDRQERFAREEEESREESRRREAEDIQRKKRAVDVSPGL
jgi:membrane protein involved in colicin uptake